MNARLISAVSVALCLAASLAGPALAHAHLKSADPAADATVSGPPSSLRLHFTEAVEIRFTGIKVAGPGGAAVATGKASLDPADAATLVVPLTGALAPGRYTVEWHATATDTHKTQGHYGFTISP